MIPITVERVVPGEYPSLLGREIIVSGAASGEVAVSRARRSAVPERVVPIHDGGRRLNLLALVARGALGGILHSAFGARAMAAERVQGVRTHPPKRDLDAKSVEAKLSTNSMRQLGNIRKLRAPLGK